MRQRNSLKWGGIILGVILLAALVAYSSTLSGNLTFTNTPLFRPDGNSEPEISIAANGTMGIVGLSWLNFGTNLWTGPFGSTPTFQGVIDAALQHPGKRIFGGGDADVDMGSTGTLHPTSTAATALRRSSIQRNQTASGSLPTARVFSFPIMIQATAR